RVDPRHRRADEYAQRLGAELLRPLLARDHECRGAVVDPARVAGRDRAALAEGRLQRGELLLARVRPWVFVPGRVADGDELVCEPALSVRSRPALLRLQRERVLLF